MKRLLLLLAVLAGCAVEGEPLPAAGQAGAVASPQADDPVAAVLAKSRLYRPPGEGPFPAVVVLHGCGGVGGHHHGWARRLVEWGYVALVVDSFGPRGHGSVCALNPQPTTAETRAGDAWAAARHLATLPFVRGDRVGAIGFSHGGSTVMNAVQGRGGNRPPLAAAVAFYPGCNERWHAQVAVPTVILIGEQDDWTPAERCRRVVAALKRPELVSMTVYPNAYHSFDRDRPGVVYVRGIRGDHRVERDPVAAPDALAKTRAFFDRMLKG